MIIVLLLALAAAPLALIVTEPRRADRHQQAVADEDADARLYWKTVRS